MNSEIEWSRITARGRAGPHDRAKGRTRGLPLEGVDRADPEGVEVLVADVQRDVQPTQAVDVTTTRVDPWMGDRGAA